MRLSDPRVLARAPYGAILEANGLGTLEGLLEVEGKVYKSNRRRRVVRIELAQDGRSVPLFIKTHANPPLPPWWARLLGRAWPTPARQEFENLQAVSELGIRTMVPVAIAEEPPGTGARRKSVLVTESLEGMERVEDYVAHVVAHEVAQKKRRLALDLAELARRFHGAGFFHKDFYLGHILVREAGEGFELYLIDLQRTDRRVRPRARWFVKDLAQMLYTAPAPAVSRTDKMRFFLAYRGVARVGPADRAFLRRILSKHRRMARRVERKGPIRDWH